TTGKRSNHELNKVNNNNNNNNISQLFKPKTLFLLKLLLSMYIYSKSLLIRCIREDMEETKLPDWTWVQCDKCLKWRRIGSGIDEATLPDKWYCKLNTFNKSFSTCDVPQEPDNLAEREAN